MEPVFIAHLATSFVVGAVWITISTLIAERYGTRIGGTLAGIPSTVVIALFFIGLWQGPDAAVVASTPIPIMAGLLSVYVVSYIFLLRFGFVKSLLGSLAVWFIAAALISVVADIGFARSIILGTVLFLIGFYLLEYWLKTHSINKHMHKHGLATVAFRAAVGSSVIAGAVFVSNIAGPFLGGVLAGFPAVLTASMIVTYKEHGAAFSAAFTKSFVVGASVDVIAFSIFAHFAYMWLGLWLGTIIAFLLTLVVAYVGYVYVGSKVR